MEREGKLEFLDMSKKRGLWRGRSSCSSISQVTTRASLVVQREIISQ
jgi:hypothetical protein